MKNIDTCKIEKAKQKCDRAQYWQRQGQTGGTVKSDNFYIKQFSSICQKYTHWHSHFAKLFIMLYIYLHICNTKYVQGYSFH